MFNEMMDKFMSTYRVPPTAFNAREAESMYQLASDEVDELAEELFEGEGSADIVDDLDLNKANVVKESLDVVYVITQRLRRMGVDVDAAMAEVHRSNMSKTVPIGKASEELEIARKRYPAAFVEEGQQYSVLRCADTNKVIKPTMYSPAIITPEMCGD